MKHTLFKLSLTALLLVGQLCMFANEFSYDGIKYSTTSSNTVEVVGTYYSSGKIAIPKKVTTSSMTYSVTSIFSNCSGLTSIEIPNSVTSIGEKAFYNCSGLASVTFPEGLINIGDNAFQYCPQLSCLNFPTAGWCKYDYITEYRNAFPDTHFDDDGFELYNIDRYNIYLDGTKLTKIADLVIPNSVTGIRNSAFYCCTGLTSVTISVTVQA